MWRKLWTIASLALFMVGAASLALTLYLWFGDWPREAKEIVDYYRSVGENARREPEPLIGNVRGRDARSLNGRWQAVIDPYGFGETAGLAARAVAPQAPSDLGEFSFENGLSLEVPGDWNTQDERLVFYEGIVWYKTEFDAEPADDARAFLWFGAANYRAAVYLNGKLVGNHEGGFTPFNFEVSDGLEAGRNLLVVRVDNRMRPEDIPTPTTDWHNYGGLTRDVFLIETSPTFVRNYHVGLGDDRDSIEGWVQVDGAVAGEPARLRIPDLGVDVNVDLDWTGRGEFSVAATPELWSPETPRLYTVEVMVGGDRTVDEIGFRTLRVEGPEIVLNGKPIFMRGISLHEEAPFGGGRARSAEHASTLLGWASELECNFVRLAHYPHNEYMLREADRRGLLVWAEIPVYWNIRFGDEATLARGRQQLSELIARDRNRASVVLWSIGNETPHAEERMRFMEALASHVRSEDPTRPVAAALLAQPPDVVRFFATNFLPAVFGWQREQWTYAIDDPLEDVVDVPGLNEYFGWYYSGMLALASPLTSFQARRIILDNMDRIRFETAGDKPLLMSEFGAGAVAGWNAPVESLTVYSEDYQAEVYRRQIAMLRAQPNVRGMSPWVLKDFRTPLRLYQGVQDHWNRKGLISDDGQRKEAFFVLRDYYREMRALAEDFT